MIFTLGLEDTINLPDLYQPEPGLLKSGYTLYGQKYWAHDHYTYRDFNNTAFKIRLYGVGPPFQLKQLLLSLESVPRFQNFSVGKIVSIL